MLFQVREAKKSERKSSLMEKGMVAVLASAQMDLSFEADFWKPMGLPLMKRGMVMQPTRLLGNKWGPW